MPVGLLHRAKTLVVGGATALTLMACYGAAYVEQQTPEAAPACADPALDEDGDGYCGEQDCDEGNPEVQCGEAEPGPPPTEDEALAPVDSGGGGY